MSIKKSAVSPINSDMITNIYNIRVLDHIYFNVNNINTYFYRFSVFRKSAANQKCEKAGDVFGIF